MIYLLTARLPKRAVMMVGILLMAVGMFFVGVNSFLGFEDGIFFSFFGMCLVGLAAGLIAIPVVPEML